MLIIKGIVMLVVTVSITDGQTYNLDYKITITVSMIYIGE